MKNAVINKTAKAAKPVGGVVQPKLAVNTPGDRYEQEADAMADQVIRMRQTGYQANGRSLQKPALSPVAGYSGSWEAPAGFVAQLESRLSGGATLPGSTRQFMETAFSTRFDQVRIHTDDQAAQMSRLIGARAFTHGNDIYFDQGQYAPDQVSGQRLLAHELSHVVQQWGSSQALLIQRDVAPQPSPGVSLQFSVRIQAQLTPEQLLVEFIRQYHRLTTDAEAVRQAHNWHWTGTPPIVTAEDVSRGYKLIQVRDRSLTPATDEQQHERRGYFQGLEPGDQADLNATTDQQFWQNTQYQPGHRLGNSATDQRMATYWMALRDELIRQRQAIENLPAEIRQFIFNETGPTLRPDQYEALLRISEKLMQMSQQERQDYLARTNARTTDLSVFEASIDRYQAQLTERRAATMTRELTKSALVGMKEVYEQYRDYKFREKDITRMPIMGDPYGAAGAMTVASFDLGRAYDELTTNLQAHGFESVAAFETAIRLFKEAFKAEAVLIANATLERYDHVLWTQEQRYQDIATSEALHQRLAPARTHFTEAQRIRDEYMASEEGIMMSMTPGGGLLTAISASVQTEVPRREGREAVSGLSSDFPLLNNSDLSAESLALAASPSDVQRIMRDYIRARRADIQQTRYHINDDPTLIWDLDTLTQQAIVQQDIQPGSVYESIIHDHIQDRSSDRMILNLCIGVLALAAGLVSMGTGTVAVLGAVTAFGISSYQAIDEYRQYEIRSAAYGAQLLSDDPSFGWVILAFVGAGLDMAGIAAALRPTVRGALQTFNQTNNVVELEQELTRLARLGEIDEALNQNLLRAATARAEASRAWDAARARYYGRTMAVIDPIVTPLANLAVNFAYPVYLSMRNGIISLERFLLTREAVSLIGDIQHLNPQQLARVRQAYGLALGHVEQIAVRGNQLRLTETEIGDLLGLWNQHPAWVVDDVLREMDTLASQTQEAASLTKTQVSDTFEAYYRTNPGGARLPNVGRIPNRVSTPAEWKQWLQYRIEYSIRYQGTATAQRAGLTAQVRQMFGGSDELAEALLVTDRALQSQERITEMALEVQRRAVSLYRQRQGVTAAAESLQQTTVRIDRATYREALTQMAQERSLAVRLVDPPAPGTAAAAQIQFERDVVGRSELWFEGPLTSSIPDHGEFAHFFQLLIAHDALRHSGSAITLPRLMTEMGNAPHLWQAVFDAPVDLRIISTPDDITLMLQRLLGSGWK